MPHPQDPPNYQAITCSGHLLADLLNTCKELCPGCYADPEHRQFPTREAKDAYCGQCGYQGPAGDWKLGWLCHTLRDSVKDKLRIALLEQKLVYVYEHTHMYTGKDDPCITMPDGTCISPLPCIHTIKRGL